MSDQSEKSQFSGVNQHLGQNVRWRPLSPSTHTNQLWTTVVSGEKLVLRLNVSEEIAFGVSREAEYKVLATIADYTWAPQILACSMRQGWCLMKFHGASLAEQGTESASGQSLSGVVREKLCQAIRQMQEIKAGPAYDYARLLQRYQQRLHRCSGSIESGSDWLSELATLLSRLPVNACCLVHHDLHAGNICWQQSVNRLVIVDWEYGGIGNPWLDNAQLLKSGLLKEEQLLQLPSARHMRRSVIAAHLKCAARANQLLEKLWHLVRNPEMSLPT